jgi:hypothetical protein
VTSRKQAQLGCDRDGVAVGDVFRHIQHHVPAAIGDLVHQFSRENGRHFVSLDHTPAALCGNRRYKRYRHDVMRASNLAVGVGRRVGRHNDVVPNADRRFRSVGQLG